MDLEGTSLQIKSDSTLGSDEQMRVNMFDKDSIFIHSVRVRFNVMIQYWITNCTIDKWVDLPVQPPVDVDKIWTITKTENAYIWTCNNVEVLNYLFAESYDSRCVWQGDIVDEIVFHPKRDSASDFFRAGKGVLKARGLRVWYHVSC